MQTSMKAVFQDLGCRAHAAKAMVEDQGIDTLDDLCFLKHSDVETLCKNVKCPGGAAGSSNRGANLGHPNQPNLYLRLPKGRSSKTFENSVQHENCTKIPDLQPRSKF